MNGPDWPVGFREAFKVAKRSPFSHKNGSVLVLGGAIVSSGWSHLHPYSAAHGLESLHAEIHALGRARHLDLDKALVFNACITPAGYLTTALPCMTCAVALYTAGCSAVFYSDVDGRWSRLPLDGALKGLKLYGERRRRGG